MRSGKSPGGMSFLTKTLSEIASVQKSLPRVCAPFPALDADVNELKVEWGRQVNELAARVNKGTSACKDFTSKHTGLYSAIDSWDFSNFPVITGKKGPSDEEKALAASVHYASKHCASWRSQLANVIQKDLSWAPLAESSEMKTLLATMDANELLIKEAVKLMACALMVEKLLSDKKSPTHDGYIDAVKFLGSEFSIDASLLPASLIKHYPKEGKPGKGGATKEPGDAQAKPEADNKRSHLPESEASSASKKKTA